MKEHILQLLEDLVGAHHYGAKRAKADEITALVKSAFPGEAETEPEADKTSVSGTFTVLRKDVPDQHE